MTVVHFATTFYTERTDETAPLAARHITLDMVPLVSTLEEKACAEDTMRDLIDTVILDALNEACLLTDRAYLLSAKAKIEWRHDEHSSDWDVEFTFENVSCFLCGTVSKEGEIIYLSSQPNHNK